MARRLGIVVPQRGRAKHLRTFLAHIAIYLCRDKVGRTTPVRLLVVEPPPARPCNRGLASNIGFQILRPEIDYVCFHDPNWLPIWADYSWSNSPATVVRHGVADHPVGCKDSAGGAGKSNPSAGPAFVVLMPADQFERVNDFSNRHWGPGCEGLDLMRRFSSLGTQCSQRDRTFPPLGRARAIGSKPSHSADHSRNPEILKALPRSRSSDAWRRDGLSDLSFQIVRRFPISPTTTERPTAMEHAVVEFSHRPPSPVRKPHRAGQAQ